LDGCLTAYENALDGYDEEGKFVHFWRRLLQKEKVSASSIQVRILKLISVLDGRYTYGCFRDWFKVLQLNL